jgi:hypothetical protein
MSMNPLKRNLVIHLSTGIFLYLLFSSLDVFFTLRGVNGDISMEGNPVMRSMMFYFGLTGGLIMEKVIVLLISLAVALVAATGIDKKSDWVYYLAFTRKTRDWMKRKKRYYVAFFPLYLVALSQGRAAATRICLIT